MYTIRIRKQLRLMDYQGRIPFLHHLLGCLRMYLKIPKYEEDWEFVGIEEEWGYYDMESKKWINL